MVENKKVDYKSLLFNPKIDNITVLHKMLLDNSYEELCKIAASIPTTFKGLLSLSFLKRKDYAFLRRRGFLLNKPYEDYVGVLAFVFKQNQKELNEYIKLREAYEKAFLLGNYSEARKYLDLIKKISYSLWSLEQDIKLERLNKGLNSCTELYGKLYKESGGLISYMSYIFYMSSSVEYNFDSEIELYYRTLKNKADTDILGYLTSHSMPYLNYKYGDWVAWDFRMSILDIYECFILALNVIDDNLIQKTDFQKNLQRIDDLLDDRRIKMFIAKNEIRSYCLSSIDTCRENLIIEYYEGKYSDVVVNYPEYNKEYPWDMGVLDLYVKSLILAGIPCPIENVNEASSINEKLIYNYYNYLIKKDNSQSLFYRNLITICHSCYSIYGISHFLDILEGYETKDLSHILDAFAKHSFGRSIRGKVPNSLFLSKKLRNYNEDKELLQLQTCPSLLQDQVVFAQLLNKVKKGNIASFIKDQTCTYLFHKLIEKKQFHDAVCFFVECKIEDSKLDIHFDKKNLKIIFEDDFELKNEIPLELSIFYTMVGFDDYKRYMPYKKVLSLFHVRHASEINLYDDKKILYFLSHVVDSKVLSLHVQRYGTLKDVYEQRLKICELLFEKTGKVSFKEEIAQIYRDLSIRRLTKKIDESKINVDVPKIISEGLNEEKVLFDLFQSSDETMKFYNSLESLIKMMNSDGLNVNFIVPIDVTKTEKINYKKSICQKLFISLRDRFLSDPKYGFDFFLSTRIRHGTLINQLRHQFQAHNLVTNIGDDGLYKDDVYWVNVVKINCEDDTYFLKQELKKFSESLDVYILHLKDDVIQIKTELINSEKKAAFDFSLPNIQPYIDYVFNNSINHTFESFVSLIFETLWNITERRLEEVKSVIDTMQVDVCCMLDNLEKDITNRLATTYNLSEFQSAIRSCKTAFQHDMDIVKSWFAINKKDDFSFYIKDVVDVCLCMHNRINNQPLVVNRDISSKMMFKGQYFDKFNDLFHDLFNNVTSYCKKAKMPINCKVEITEKNEMLCIKVSNKLLATDIEIVKATIEHFENQEHSLLMAGMGRRERSSGIVKISNIVANLLPGKNSYKNSIENSMFIASININMSFIKA